MGLMHSHHDVDCVRLLSGEEQLLNKGQAKYYASLHLSCNAAHYPYRSGLDLLKRYGDSSAAATTVASTAAGGALPKEENEETEPGPLLRAGRLCKSTNTGGTESGSP